MNLQGVNFLLVAVLAIVVAVAVGTGGPKQSEVPIMPTSPPSPEVAGESVHINTSTAQVEVSTVDPTSIPTIIPRVFSALITVTPSPTPTPTPTP